MSNQHRPIDAELLQQSPDELRLRARRVVPLWTVGPAKALEIYRHHPVRPGERGDDRPPDVERRSESVQQNHGVAEAPFEVVHSRSTHVFEGGVPRLAGKRTRVEIESCGWLEPGTLRTGGEQQARYL